MLRPISSLHIPRPVKNRKILCNALPLKVGHEDTDADMCKSLSFGLHPSCSWSPLYAAWLGQIAWEGERDKRAEWIWAAWGPTTLLSLLFLLFLLLILLCRRRPINRPPFKLNFKIVLTLKSGNNTGIGSISFFPSNVWNCVWLQ